MNEEEKTFPPELVWEEIKDNDTTQTKRARVYGGWLVQLYWEGLGGVISTAFVPDEYRNWNSQSN